MTQKELIEKSKLLGMQAILESINKIIKGDVATIPNNDHEQSYYRFPTKADVIKFKERGARFY
jgi:methionyl-tRNA formyltransferase